MCVYVCVEVLKAAYLKNLFFHKWHRIICTAQGWNNRTLAVHERVECRFLVLPGSRSTISEIIEYTYFSPLKPRREFEYKSE